jgi:hypothetical protein
MAARCGDQRSRTPRGDDMAIEPTPPQLAGIAELLKGVIQGAGLAKSAQVEALGARMAKHEEIQDDHTKRIAKMEEMLKKMFEDMGEDRSVRGAQAEVAAQSYAAIAAQAATSASAPRPRAAPASADWVPSLLQVRGFAPYKCANEEKLGRDEFRDETAKLLAILPDAITRRLEACPPFAVNHQLAFRIRAKDSADVREVVLEINTRISERNHKIRGHALRVSTEIHPDRKVLFANCFGACEILATNNIPKTRYDMCNQSLKLYVVPTMRLLGETSAQTRQWVWQKEALDNLGLKDSDVDMS